jgi:hypothetical protein
MSLKQVSGGPSPAAIAETRTNAKAASGVSGKYAVVQGSDQAPNEFPYVPFAPDTYDDTADIKETFARSAAAGGAAGDNWVVPFTEQDAAYVKRQRDQVENADFDRWVMQKYDLNDPSQLFLFQSIAPDQFQRRMDLIDYQQNLVTKYAKMRLMGARSLEDLKFEWLIETGRIELPKGPIWDPVAWMGKQMNLTATPTTNDEWFARNRPNNNRFMAGLFSPLQYLNETQVGWEPNEINRSDIRGVSGRRTVGQLFQGSDDTNAPYEEYGSNPIKNGKYTQYQRDKAPVRFGWSGGGAARAIAGRGADPAPHRRGYGFRPLVA